MSSKSVYENEKGFKFVAKLKAEMKQKIPSLLYPETKEALSPLLLKANLEIFFQMKEFIKLIKNIFSKEPFEQDITIRFSLSLEQIIFIF
ncbi:hypothetical protein [Riemerella anatipestifer]|uniref:Uncharacterized protein n=2 Tax=Riemerella anatipestifer TaxID=34085 RepID=J9R8E2_RIEAN|nr:hypothetical protein [Riemerella anatipestifer]AFR35687.1 hypothetical protein B739_1088 [Riemerella anatipestifer RA-CH-1]MCO7351738.1 hypothetical protein [Riemerella anatipestifer]MCU7583567.1 hypothetical protein [Riemerella anatipestifer]MCW0487145.1 hypothetical protein [Riemerella anatipestifer]MDR7765632.1 hypothetical protein [Riemerella anatipestifer]